VVKNTNIKRRLSVIYIVNRQNIKNLKALIPQVAEFGDEIILISQGPKSIEDELVSHFSKKIKIIQASDLSHFYKVMTTVVQGATGEWILWLGLDEFLRPEDQNRVEKLCEINEHRAYYLISNQFLGNSDLSQYEWREAAGKYSSINFQKSAYVPRLEIRLFKKEVLKNFQPCPHNSLNPVLLEHIENIPFVCVELNRINTQKSSAQEISVQETMEEDFKRFITTGEGDRQIPKGFEFLEPENIGYSLVDKKDIPSLFAGLDLGFGHIDILKYMVHKYIKYGDYDAAISLSDTFLKKLGEHIEFWRLKGSAYFYKLDLVNAEICYRKGLSIQSDDTNLLINFARVLIVARRFQEAKEVLEEANRIEGFNSETEFLLNSIAANKGRVAKLSLLMIVRDEEKYISRALKSVESVVDEMIVIDTGSKDQTAHAARAYGARVISHEWSDHFAEARNAGLEKVTGDYVLHMDADEFFDNEARIALLVFKNVLPIDNKKAIIFDVKTFAAEDPKNKDLPPKGMISRTAIFPALSGVRFSGRIFERVDPALDRIGIERIQAKNIHIIHQSNNEEFRSIRKLESIHKSLKESFNIENMVECILFCFGLSKFEEAKEWFLKILSERKDSIKYINIIGYLANYFDQNGYVGIDSFIFNELIEHYKNSYKIRTLCSDILLRNGHYEEAFNMLVPLIYEQNRNFDDQPGQRDIQKNIMNLSLASLEIGKNNEYEKTIEAMISQEDVPEAARALIFYGEVKKREIERAIDILDNWIRERSLPVKGPIDNFTDFIGIIGEVAKLMIQYGQLDAGKILIRSAEHLIDTLNINKGKTHVDHANC